MPTEASLQPATNARAIVTTIGLEPIIADYASRLETIGDRPDWPYRAIVMAIVADVVAALAEGDDIRARAYRAALRTTDQAAASIGISVERVHQLAREHAVGARIGGGADGRGGTLTFTPAEVERMRNRPARGEARRTPGSRYSGWRQKHAKKETSA